MRSQESQVTRYKDVDMDDVKVYWPWAHVILLLMYLLISFLDLGQWSLHSMILATPHLLSKSPFTVILLINHLEIMLLKQLGMS